MLTVIRRYRVLLSIFGLITAMPAMASNGALDTPSGIQSLDLSVEGQPVLTLTDNPAKMVTVNGALQLTGWFGVLTNTPQAPLDVRGEIASTLTNVSNIRMIGGNVGAMWRNDGTALYLLYTDAGNAWGGWNGLRPVTFSLSDQNAHFGGRIATGGLDPNDIPTGWGGGIRTWDIYAGGTIAVGPSAGNLSVYMNGSGLNASVPNGYGVYSSTANVVGVQGVATGTGVGVLGYAAGANWGGVFEGPSYGVYGSGGTWAGYFNGPTNSQGDIYIQGVDAIRRDGTNAYLFPWASGYPNQNVVIGGGAYTNLIVPNGYVGIGIGAPMAPLQVEGGPAVSSCYSACEYGHCDQSTACNTAGNNPVSILTHATIIAGALRGSNIDTISDARKKEKITSIPASEAFDFINRVEPVHFEWKDKTTNAHQNIGYIAQQLVTAGYRDMVDLAYDKDMKAERVNTSDGGSVDSPAGASFAANYIAAIPYLHTAIKEMLQEIQDLKAENKALDDGNKALAARLDALEQRQH